MIEIPIQDRGESLFQIREGKSLGQMKALYISLVPPSAVAPYGHVLNVSDDSFLSVTLESPGSSSL